MILVEANSVIARAEALQAKLPGGLAAFCNMGPGFTFCSDGEICRVAFYKQSDLNIFTDRLIRRGLKPSLDGEPSDFTVLSQKRVMEPGCPWLVSLYLIMKNGAVLAAAYLKDGKAAGGKDVKCPQGWEYKGSWSEEANPTAVELGNMQAKQAD